MLRKFTFRLSLAALAVGFIFLARTATTPSLPAPTDPPRFYSTQLRDDLQLTLSGAIDRAEHSVHLAIYTLTDRKILRALHNAAARGCAVTVAYDAKAGRPKLSPLVERRPAKPKGLMHRKILVIDDHEVWLGSANFTYESLRIHDNLIVAISSPQLASDLIDAITGRQTRAPPRLYENDIELWLLPEDKGALNRLIDLIDTAQTRIRVAMFTWTHPALTEAIIRAHRRGLDVHISLDQTSAAGASAPALARLHEEGVKVLTSVGPGLLHHKLALIDDTLVLGSANWTRSAFTRNDDCFLILPGYSAPLL
jgi:phosphatidylserine/phosphatidylglycerophosphate/cardiolipin synthase-like enzyme